MPLFRDIDILFSKESKENEKRENQKTKLVKIKVLVGPAF